MLGRGPVQLLPGGFGHRCTGGEQNRGREDQGKGEGDGSAHANAPVRTRDLDFGSAPGGWALSAGRGGPRRGSRGRSSYNATWPATAIFKGVPVRLGILCGGGPAPGINSVISAATIEACNSGWEVIGILDGFEHLIEGDTMRVQPLEITDVSRIHVLGGSILFT